MPSRGGGAAMLRDLRDEERPSQETQEKPSQETQDILPEQEVSPKTETDNQADAKDEKSYDNMTNNLTDNKTEHKANKKEVNKTGKQTGKLASQSASHQVIKPESQTDSQNTNSQNTNQSVADMIRRRAAQRGEQEVLKTVTLKLSPALDERVEQYCFDNKMKKQEFWAEAAALYFEMIAQGEGF